MLDAFPVRTSVPEVRAYPVRIEGAGAANPDKELGPGVTVTWVSTGRYRFTWGDHPGTWVGAPKPGLQATTPADVDTWDAVFGAWDATNKRIDVYVYSSAGNLADLAAASWMYIEPRFKQTGV